MPPAPTCPHCNGPLPPDAARGAWCPACRVGPVAPARPETSNARPRKPKRRAEREYLPARPGNPYRAALFFAQGLYVPFLGGVIVLGLTLSAVLVVRGAEVPRGEFTPGWMNWRTAAGVAVGLSVLHLVVGAMAVFKPASDEDPLEFELPDSWQEGLADMVDRVAADRDLPPPDAIRMHAATVAHVYQDRRRRTVLVLGGLAVAALPQRALAGVVAHELAHAANGDTAASARAARWHAVMTRLDLLLLTKNWVKWNPLAWVFRAYHHLYARLWFAYQRACEYEADYHQAVQAGADEAAGTLVLMTVLGEMEWANLGAVAEAAVETNQRVDLIFAEQVRRLREAHGTEWMDAMRKALRRRAAWYDTHPSLDDRLDFLGVRPKRALQLAADLDGEPAAALFANWPVVEKFLTKTVITIVRNRVRTRQEMEDLIEALSRIKG